MENSSNHSQNAHVGNVKTITYQKNSISGTTDTAYFKISVFSTEVIRVQVNKFSQFYPNPYSVIKDQNIDTNIEIKKSDGQSIIATDKLEVVINHQPFHIKFNDQSGQILNEDDESFSISWLGTEVTNYKKLQPNEKFIGLGEKTGNLDRSGAAYTNWNTDYFAYGVGDDPLYMSIPFYMGVLENRAYGIFFDNTHKSIFNFGASNRRFMYYSADDGDMDYYFIHDDSVADIISHYTSLTGRMELPPKWALGFQQCRYSYYPESEVLTLANTFRDKKMPADVIYLDIHHMEKYKVFTFDGEKFPNPQQMIQSLKEKGFRVVVIMDPGIKVEKGYDPYDDGKANDLFIKFPDGEDYEGQVWPGWCTFPDFTMEKTRKWWGEKMKFYKDAGVDGYWTDMNEPASWGQFTPNLINFDYEGEQVSHRKARNIYGMQMAKAAKEGSEKQNPKERPFVLTRAGFSGVQRYAAAWTGDNVSTDAHMLAGIRLVNSLGISGVSFAGYDIGGFAGEASKGLFARWMSIAAFAPLFRAHSMINSNDAEPWAFGEEVEEISRNYMKLRYQLLPTIYSYFYKSAMTGQSIATSLAIPYSFDKKIYSGAYQNQYLFCDSFLIAPVESFKEITKVYLPEGDWYYFYDDKKYIGKNEIYVDCPLSYLPVFVKAGAVFTMQSSIQHTADQNDGHLHVHVYAGKVEQNFVHYEDDGISLSHLKGEYLKRNIIWNSAKKKLHFESTEGNYVSDFHTIVIHLHGFSDSDIQIDQQSYTTHLGDFAFLDKLTDFDPLPDHSHPHLKIKELISFTIPYQAEDFTIQF
ncbi:glycoside hydrolase family 31 protein [Belliella sp. DSM 111904]|uniref:Glycoside hydrolase family 31 protein n=1 Tax=Belliella filtrata TaxID=2923435 RepID=A0ABS9UXR9_9BACT|nr:glycoside hydrolase family 31 protein [Belliella filtrata]MCH7408548.1 glycoside hydrolase family 31 protein [Belliella filtrata]